MNLRTCVAPSGEFIYGIHKPHFRVENLRERDYIMRLGAFVDERLRENHANFPQEAVNEPEADWIFEIPNAFPFRGTTFIARSWADAKARNPKAIALPAPPAVSLAEVVGQWFKDDDLPAEQLNKVFYTLPQPLRLALAATSTDPDDLTRLAEMSCRFIHDPATHRPVGLLYRQDAQGRVKADIRDRTLFEILANNMFLPDTYKKVMVLRPGVQGTNEIVGDQRNEETGSHVFEYLRRNSYIPWGHYAANMAHDAVRYQIRDLTMADMAGMRHLYYQRSYVLTANQLGLALPCRRRSLSVPELEELRNRINDALSAGARKSTLQFDCTLWGWNFGFDFAPSRYRLHASHQQIHQQFALIPAALPAGDPDDPSGTEMPTFACGDLISSFIQDYREQTGKSFFENYIKAIRNNRRMDGHKDGENSLVVYQDDHVMLFVPKAQTSQWELQLMTLKWIGNILEADSNTRRALDRAMLIAMRILTAMGARMVSTIEYSKRFNSSDTDQRLLYAFLPKMPESPGAFSEAQLRWINGHYPEDFASACRARMAEALHALEH